MRREFDENVARPDKVCVNLPRTGQIINGTNGDDSLWCLFRMTARSSQPLRMPDDVVESVTLGDTLRDTSSEVNEQNDENVSIYGET